MRKAALLVVLTICACTVFAQKNNARSVTTTEAMSHVIQSVAPKAPPVASLANVGGSVKVHIVVSVSGAVASATAVSGAPVLFQAATDAVKQWKFRPFLEGDNPMSVAADVEVNFPGGLSQDQSTVNQKYFGAENECRSLMKATKFIDAEVKCREVVELSNQLPKDAVLERSDALSLLANDLVSQRRFAESIPFYERALELGRGYLKTDDADLASAV